MNAASKVIYACIPYRRNGKLDQNTFCGHILVSALILLRGSLCVNLILICFGIMIMTNILQVVTG